MPFKESLAGAIVSQILLGGTPLTSLEAMLYCGYADLAKKVTRLQRHGSLGGLKIQSRSVPLATVLARVEATLLTPASVHPFVKEIASQGMEVTEYFYIPRKDRKAVEPQAIASAIFHIDRSFAIDRAA